MFGQFRSKKNPCNMRFMHYHSMHYDNFYCIVEKKYYGKCHTMHGNRRLNDISNLAVALHFITSNGNVLHRQSPPVGCAYISPRLYAMIVEVRSLNTMPQLGTAFAYSVVLSLKKIPS